MSLVPTRLSSQDTQELIAREFGGTFGDIPLRYSLAADHIRSALHANATLAREHNLSPSVHTSRLLTSVRKALDMLWPGAATEHLRDSAATENVAQQTLNSLSEFGDIVDTGGGYWVGTPLRFVCCGDTSLAVGAAPNAILKSLLGIRPICAGISRFAEARSMQSAEQAISVSDWLGRVQDIRSWSKGLIEQHERKMQSGNDIPADQLEIFAPDLLTGAQRNPWIHARAINRPLKGTRLCRPVKAFAYVWDRPFFLSQLRFSDGELVISRGIRVEYSFTRRLRFGLSALYGTVQPVSGTTSGDLVQLEMPLALPHPEARVAALGWPLSSNSSRTVFHRRAIPLLTEVLARLSVPVIVR